MYYYYYYILSSDIYLSTSLPFIYLVYLPDQVVDPSPPPSSSSALRSKALQLHTILSKQRAILETEQESLEVDKVMNEMAFWQYYKV